MTKKPVVLVTRKLPDSVERRLGEHFETILNPDDKLYTRDELLQLADKVDAILPCHTEKFPAETIALLPPRIKAIANYSVGVDHVASEGERTIRNQQWKDWSPAFMVGRQITNKRLGILGMGRVGQVVARRARGFDMEIHYHNRKPLDSSHEQGATYHSTVEELVSEIDVLSINCPASEKTRGLVNARLIAKMPAHTIIINTSRGVIVDDDALIDALKSGRIAAAGLDVFNGEPDAIHPQYRQLDNVFLLPHIGSATEETREAMGFRAIDNLIAIFNGEEPGDRVA
jgi:lactate dehydrogenase-like 2-hydroxyacid dehydrogenase